MPRPLPDGLPVALGALEGLAVAFAIVSRLEKSYSYGFSESPRLRWSLAPHQSTVQRLTLIADLLLALLSGAVYRRLTLRSAQLHAYLTCLTYSFASRFLSVLAKPIAGLYPAQ